MHLRLKDPRSIQVTARDGAVTLSGPVLAHEVDNLLRTVSNVRGVKDVENRLEVHQHPGDVPGTAGVTGEEREIARPDRSAAEAARRGD